MNKKEYVNRYIMTEEILSEAYRASFYDRKTINFCAKLLRLFLRAGLFSLVVPQSLKTAQRVVLIGLPLVWFAATWILTGIQAKKYSADMREKFGGQLPHILVKVGGCISVEYQKGSVTEVINFSQVQDVIQSENLFIIKHLQGMLILRKCGFSAGIEQLFLTDFCKKWSYAGETDNNE